MGLHTNRGRSGNATVPTTPGSITGYTKVDGPDDPKEIPNGTVPVYLEYEGGYYYLNINGIDVFAFDTQTGEGVRLKDVDSVATGLNVDEKGYVSIE